MENFSITNLIASLKTKSFSLTLYFLAVFITILGVILENEAMILFAKPIIIPSIFFYYLSYNKGKANCVFVFIFLLYFITDMLVVLDIKHNSIVVIMLNAFAYLLIFYHIAREMIFNKIKKKIISYIILVCIVSIALLLFMNLLIQEEIKIVDLCYRVYSVILFCLFLLVCYQFLSEDDMKGFIGLIMGFTFLFSDIFYVLYYFYAKLFIFKLIFICFQFLSYFYLVRYITASTNNKLNKV